MKKQLPYSVPDNYFENLESRILSRKRTGRFPLSAIAASILILIGASAFFLGKSSGTGTALDGNEDAIIEYLIDSGAPLAYFEDNL